MVTVDLRMGFQLACLLFLASFPAILAQGPTDATIVIRGATKIAETDDNFICATMDWWPPAKCNFKQCPWSESRVDATLEPHIEVGNVATFVGRLKAGLPNMPPLQDQVLYDVGKSRYPCHPVSKKSPGFRYSKGCLGSKSRADVTFDASLSLVDVYARASIERLKKLPPIPHLQDQVLYDVGKSRYPRHPFSKKSPGFRYSKGCLGSNGWDELHHFFNKTGAIVTLGLNARYGKRELRKGVWSGAWDSSTTYNFLKYSIAKGYKIDSLEFGNGLSGKEIDAEEYGKDLIKLNDLINELYGNSHSRPMLLASGGNFNEEWYAKLLEVSGPGVVDAITHPTNNLGTGDDPHLANKILDPHHLNLASESFGNLQRAIDKHGPWSSAWVDESGGPYNSGRDHLAPNTFVDTIWYLDQLGMASKFNTKVYCHNSLIYADHDIVNTSTFVPNPDYFSALLWRRVMGKRVLSVRTDASPYLRAYAHCSKAKGGVTLLLINLSNQTDFKIAIQNDVMTNTQVGKNARKEGAFIHGPNTTTREEYHLTANGNLRSRIMLLNGTPLELTKDGDIPRLDPVRVKGKSPISIAPLSIAFIAFPYFNAPACLQP